MALTFDDGPRPATTPAVLDVLASRRVPATFFAVGVQVERHPALARRVLVEGHRLENHTWAHERLPRLSAGAVRGTLQRTTDAVRRLGPAPRLYRPPYGSTGPVVRAAGTALGLREVLWTVDSQDYRPGRTARQIADRVLASLHPRAVVLLHDGVGNSPRTAEALPRIIDEARSRGFCFGVLDDAGAVRPPVPVVGVEDVVVTEPAAGASTVVAVPVVLSAPTSRAVDVRLVTQPGTAALGSDVRAVDAVVRLPAGSRRGLVRLELLGDGVHEGQERLTVQAVAAAGATVTGRVGTVVVVDRDPPPVLTVEDQVLTEPVDGSVVLPVVVRLSAPSARPVRVRVRGTHATTTADDLDLPDAVVTVPAGASTATVPVTVRSDVLLEPLESFVLVLSDVAGALTGQRAAVVGVRDRPPADPDPAQGRMPA